MTYEIKHVKGKYYTLSVNNQVVFKTASLRRCKLRVHVLMTGNPIKSSTYAYVEQWENLPIRLTA